MNLSMITHLTSPMSSEEPRMAANEHGRYGRPSSDEVVYEDGLERHPSRLKRARLDSKEEADDDDGDRARRAARDGAELSSKPSAKLLANSHTPIPPLPRSAAIGHREEAEDEADGHSPSNSFHSSSSSSSTLTHSQHSSPLQPTTPDTSQPFPPSSWPPSEPGCGWPTKPRVVTEEMELLAEIEKQAETYASGPASEALLLSHWPVGGRPAAHPADARVLAAAPESGGPAAVQDKPFKCSLCPKSFTRNYDLTRHKSSHIDQRQHRCSKCGRSFNRRDALIRHALVKSCGPHP